MANGPGADRNLPVEVATAIRKEAVSQTAKWFIRGFIVAASLAVAGWWFILEPKLKSYIADAAGGVPSNGIIASTEECSKLAGQWTAFKEGTGRFVVGAGTETYGNYPYLEASNGSKKKISNYQVMETGGQEEHFLANEEMPALIPQGRGDLGAGDQHALVGLVYGRNEKQKSIGLVPPYIGLYLCKKK